MGFGLADRNAGQCWLVGLQGGASLLRRMRRCAALDLLPPLLSLWRSQDPYVFVNVKISDSSNHPPDTQGVSFRAPGSGAWDNTANGAELIMCTRAAPGRFRNCSKVPGVT